MPTPKAGLRWKIAQWAERKWWKRYLRKKNVAEYHQWKKNYWNTFLADLQLAHLQKEEKSIIDLGCGPAGIFMNLQSNQCTAVDPLLDAYEHDLAHFDKSQYPNTTFINAGIEDYVPAQKFDHIFCINAINHVNDIEVGMNKLSDCAHETSQLIISIDAHNHNFLKKIFQLLPGDILHPHQYNLEEYQALVERAGWKITQTVEMDKAFIFNYYVLVATKVQPSTAR